MKPTLEVLRSYESALERLEIVGFEVDYENRAAAVRSLAAWATALKPREKVEVPPLAEIPISAPEASVYAAVLQQRQMGGRA